MWICVLCETDYRGSPASQASLAITFDLCCKRPAPDCGYSTFKPLPLNPPLCLDFAMRLQSSIQNWPKRSEVTPAPLPTQCHSC